MFNKRKSKEPSTAGEIKKFKIPNEAEVENPLEVRIKIEDDHIGTVNNEETDMSHSVDYEMGKENDYIVESVYTHSTALDPEQDLEDETSDIEETEQVIVATPPPSTDEKDPLAMIDFDNEHEFQRQTYESIVYSMKSKDTQYNTKPTQPEEKLVERQTVQIARTPSQVVTRITNQNNSQNQQPTNVIQTFSKAIYESSNRNGVVHTASSHFTSNTVTQPTAIKVIDFRQSAPNQVQLVTQDKHTGQFIPVQTNQPSVVIVQPTANPQPKPLQAKILLPYTQSPATMNISSQTINTSNLTQLGDVCVPVQRDSINSTAILLNLLQQQQQQPNKNTLVIAPNTSTAINHQRPLAVGSNGNYITILPSNPVSQIPIPSNLGVSNPNSSPLGTVIRSLVPISVRQNPIQSTSSSCNIASVITPNPSALSTAPSPQTSTYVLSNMGQKSVEMKVVQSNTNPPPYGSGTHPVSDRCCIFDDLLKMNCLPALWTHDDKVQLILEGKPQKMGFLPSNKYVYRKFEWMTGCSTQGDVLCWPCLLFAKQVWTMKLNAKAEDAIVHEAEEEHKKSNKILIQSTKAILKDYGDYDLLQLKLNKRKSIYWGPTRTDSAIILNLLLNPFSLRSDAEKRQIIRGGRPCPSLPDKVYEGSYFDKKLYITVSWLTASEDLGKFFCWSCLLYDEHGIWARLGFANTHTLPAAILLHENTTDHITSDAKLHFFVSNLG